MTSYQVYNIDFSDFSLQSSQFDQQSHLHGIKHTYRVMLHCLRLGILTSKIKEAKVAFFGAYIHDMARTHDGYDTVHGANSVKHKLPFYTPLFNKHGATEDDIKVINQIVTHHSLPGELPKSDDLFPTLAILKDADALDRIRLGQFDLDPKYLRHEEAHTSISFGKELYYATHPINVSSFIQVLNTALELDKRQG
jgi:HD superfamily phosphodiesterase